VRLALGAGRLNIVRQLLLESLLLGCLGGLAGLLLALWGMRLFATLEPGLVPRWNPVGIDARVVLFAGCTAAVASLLAALVPARQVFGSDLLSSLKGIGAGSAGPVRQRLRQALVVSEVAFAFILATGAGLLIHSLYRVQQVDPGFRFEGLLATSVSLAPTRYPADADQHRFFQDLLASLTVDGTIREAAMVTTLPMTPVGIDHDMGFRA
jgi:hypothetical protein